MKIDMRTRYTLTVIRDNFIKLLRDNAIEKITVKKLCDKAEINRATFYRYYEDVFDLYKKFKEELIEEIFSDFKFRGISSIQEDLAYFLGSIRKNADTVYALSNQKDSMNFMQSVCERVYYGFAEDFRKVCSGLNESQLMTTYYFIVCGSTGIIAAWITRGMENDEKVISENLTKLITNTLNNL